MSLYRESVIDLYRQVEMSESLIEMREGGRPHRRTEGNIVLDVVFTFNASI